MREKERQREREKWERARAPHATRRHLGTVPLPRLHLLCSESTVVLPRRTRNLVAAACLVRSPRDSSARCSPPPSPRTLERCTPTLQLPALHPARRGQLTFGNALGCTTASSSLHVVARVRGSASQPRENVAFACDVSSPRVTRFFFLTFLLLYHPHPLQSLDRI